MKKKLLVLQSNYVPWKGYFDAINKADVFVIYDEMQYTKNDWRNRNVIKTKQGLQWLTIPVKMHFGQKINEAEVSQQFWYVKHWKTLVQNYSRASYFKEIEALLRPLYANLISNNLSEINLAFIKRINEYLGITTKIVRSRELVFSGDKNERLIQICQQLSCNHYISGPAAKSYMDIQLFESNNISVEFLDYSDYKEYRQMFGNFEHHVSILDLLFNEGPNALSYIENKIC
ncbi:WbqC family protein [Seonamhaeicola sp.]|uniref:WbqC family protein n=1 Tax=Seonamhaeicola sp. TaxID=1912245 RepID=UPI00262C2438|nr:WbqC family protein [Seonamhaeicola sp.]